MAIDPDFGGTRQLDRQHLHRAVRCDLSEEQAESAAAQREQQTFSEELANQATPSCAEGNADSEFAGAPGGARKQEIGNVGAGDQQDKSHGTKQNEQHWPHVTEHFFAEVDESGADAFVGRGKCLREIVGDALHVRGGLIERDAGFEPADAVDTEPGFALVE